MKLVAQLARQGSGTADIALTGELIDLYQPLAVGSVARGPAEYPRQKLAEALGLANQKWGHTRAENLSQSLAVPSTKVIVTGQQPGIFGGPFYTVIKALTATLLAEQMEQAGQPAVAVFWIAGEDHDFREVSSATWLERGRVRQETLGKDASPLLPVGQRHLGPATEELVAQWAEVSQSGYWQQEAQRLAVHYHSEATFSGAFAAYLVSVLGEKCPLLLDSQNSVVKGLEQPLLRRLIEEREIVTEQLSNQDERIRALGLSPQIRSRPGSAPLFLHHDGRRKRILWREGGFVIDENSSVRSVEELLDMLEANPESVSPSALARPAIQDALLGTSLFVVGPGELAYMAQAAPLYEVLEVSAPGLVLRPSVAIAPKRKLDQMTAADLPLEVLMAGENDLETALARLSGSNPVFDAKTNMETTLEQLRTPLSALHPDLAQALEKTKVNVAKAMERLGTRVDRELAQQDETTAHRAREVQQLLSPGGNPQERVFSTAFLLARFGPDLPLQLSQALKLEPGQMQLMAV